MFNYANTTSEGLVDNTLTTFDGASGEHSLWRGYVNSNFPLFVEDFLVQAGGVFSGLVQRDLTKGAVASVGYTYAMFLLRLYVLI